MSVFVILALLVCIEAQGTRETPVIDVDDYLEDYVLFDLGDALDDEVTVQDPVSPVDLSVVSVDSVVSRSSASCNLTVTCSTQDSHISSTFTCVNRTCSQEGGERAEVTTSGASLQVYLLNSSIICRHSNQVSSTKDSEMIEHVCPKDAEAPPAGMSVHLLKIVVFSVGLIIMVSAVVTVHLMEKLRKHK